MRIETVIDDRLRERPQSGKQLSEALQESARSLKDLRRRADDRASTLNTTRLGRQLQRHGRYLRLDGAFDEALSHKDEARQIWERYERRKAHFLCRLQQSVILFEAARCEPALSGARSLEEQLDDETAVYRDMVWEALGKCRFGVGDIAESIDRLEEALAIRLDRGNRRHIERTRRLIRLVEDRRI